VILIPDTHCLCVLSFNRVPFFFWQDELFINLTDELQLKVTI